MRHTLRSRAERLWLGLVLVWLLGMLGGTILADWALPGLDFGAAWWTRPVAGSLPLPLVSALFLTVAGGVGTDLWCNLPFPVRNVWWWAAVGVCVYLVYWGVLIGYPTLVIVFGGVGVSTACSMLVEPPDDA